MKDGLKVQVFHPQPVKKAVVVESKKSNFCEVAFSIAFSVMAVATLLAAFWG